MRRKTVILLIAILLPSILFISCNQLDNQGTQSDTEISEYSVDLSKDELFKEASDCALQGRHSLRIPALTVTVGTKSLTATTGGISLTETFSDGCRQSMLADAPHVLQDKTNVPSIEYNPDADGKTAVLDFSVTPDEVKVLCWPGNAWNKYGVIGEDVTVTVSETDGKPQYSFPLKEGSYIYQISATWKDSQGLSGFVLYGFYTQ